MTDRDQYRENMAEARRVHDRPERFLLRQPLTARWAKCVLKECCATHLCA
jgi:hypothetical protein